MGLISDLQNLINEHGSSSILRERLLLMKEKVECLEKEVSDLKEALCDSQKEITKLRKQIEEKAPSEEFVEHRGVLFKRLGGGYHQAVFCPNCQTSMFSLHNIAPYQCSKCGFIADFKGSSLNGIISALPK